MSIYILVESTQIRSFFIYWSFSYSKQRNNNANVRTHKKKTCKGDE